MSTATICAFLWLGGTALLQAQTTPGASSFQNQFPDPLHYKPPAPAAPTLELHKIREFPLRGRLTGAPRIVAGRIEIPTSAGLICSGWDSGAEPAPCETQAPDATSDPDWAVSPEGAYRVLPGTDDRLRAQKACRRCRDGWRRGWRLRVPGLAAAAPLVTARRVYFGAADNRVFGVKRHNGHRLWSTPVEGRVLRPLTLWVDPDDDSGERRLAAILAVPEPGRELVVIDARGGRLTLHYRVPAEDDLWVGSPLTTTDGLVILARQGYSDADASLIVLRLLAAEPLDAPEGEIGPAGYTPPAPHGTTPSAPPPGP